MATIPPKVTILNVDDNEISLYTKSRILQRAGFEVKEASTGQKALQLAVQERPQLVLLDVHLPDISGLEVCQRIKADPALASTLVLQISASFVEGKDKARGLEGGADGYMVEPVEPDELVANVKALLRLWQAEARLREQEAELRVLNQTLEQRVADRTAELERSVKELDQFAYIASHDLKAPLRAINHLANWIVEDAGDLLPETSKTHLAKLQSRIRRMEMLLNDLLTYSRVGRRYYQKIETVDTGALVREVIDLLGPPPSFIITVQEDMPILATHRVPLELIFGNLIDNAIKHHHRADGRVHVSAREIGDFFEFSVTDDGPGIDEAFHERIFLIFQTLQPRDQVEGSGMGLAIVKKAVDNQGGIISITSARGQGTTVRFTWPKICDPNNL
jgi:signal transduction histidine kinase